MSSVVGSGNIIRYNVLCIRNKDIYKISEEKLEEFHKHFKEVMISLFICAL